MSGVDCFSTKKWKDWVLKMVEKGMRVREGSPVCTEGYSEWFANVSWTMISPITVDLAADDDVRIFRIHQRKEACVNEDGDTPEHQCRDALNEQVTLSPNAYDTMPIQAKSGGLDQQITTLNDELQKLKEDKDKKPQTNIKLAEALKEKFTSEVVNTEEMKKSLEVNNNEWEVWRQALKNALASEGMGDMGDPTFEEIFDQNKIFFIITQQGPKGDYQEDLVSTELTLKNIIIVRRENMAKKKKIEEVIFQPWVKYLLDVRGIDISNNNSAFMVLATIQHQSQHRFLDVMKMLKSFLSKDPVFWKSVFSQTLGIKFSPTGEKAYEYLL
ncbi:hypothetical protein GIB67_012496 [Kingdonia uniflora]|uniref:Uncharacterized protein n=1 Tax=Kingdonia uniflora TaxID=39325 RepID=A0A7J7MVD2_9MAGN|nr:hypothetical protein GIB67_012496 [Kingdonia uniflora]